MAKTKKTKAPKTAPSPKRNRAEVDEPLPGLEGVRDQALNRLCMALAENHAVTNEAKRAEIGLNQAALNRMHVKGLSTYRYAGVELALIPSGDKLRVRTIKDATADAPDHAEGTGQGAEGHPVEPLDDADEGDE